MVFRGSLPDQRKPVPIGYQRQATGEQHDEWR